MRFEFSQKLLHGLFQHVNLIVQTFELHMHLGHFLPIGLLVLGYLGFDLIVSRIDHLLQCMDATGPVCAVFAHSEGLHDIQKAMISHLRVQLHNADEMKSA